MSHLKAVLFDLDGTVLYTLEDICASTNRTLRAFGAQERSMEELRQAVGNGARHQVGAYFPGGEGGPRFEEAMVYYKEDYTRHCADHAVPYDGIPEALSRLKAAGLKLAIVTNKPQAPTQVLYRAHFEGLVDFAIGETPEIPRKPAADMVDLALSRLGVSRAEAAYVGDSEVDMATAKSACLPCFSVSWGYRTPEELRAFGASRLFDTPTALTQALLAL